MTSADVDCYILMLTLLTYLSAEATTVDPDHTAPIGNEQSDLGQHCLYKRLLRHLGRRQNQTTVVVIGALRVRIFRIRIFAPNVTCDLCIGCITATHMLIK